MSLYSYLSTIVGVDSGRQLHHTTRRRVTAFGLAIHIPVIVWALTGFVIANQLFEQSQGLSGIAALSCGVLIYFVERLVLESPSSWQVNTFRFVLGVAVSILGATAVDLVLFDREVTQQLKAAGAERIRMEFDGQIDKAEQAQAEKKRDWLAAQQAAKCEANGTCGSRIVSVGPVYRELVRQAETLRTDYAETTAALQELRAQKVKALSDWEASDTATKEAGLLARIKALHAYLNDDVVAMAAWGLFFALMVALELMVVVAKWAFGNTVDDEIDAIKELLSLHRVKSYRDAVTSPAYAANRLIEAPIS